MLNKKYTFTIFVILVTLFFFISINISNKKTIKEEEKKHEDFLTHQYTKDDIIEVLKQITKSSSIFLVNFAEEELKEKLKHDMEDTNIQAIVIKDFFLDENFVVAYRASNNEIEFSHILPEKFKKYKAIKEKIVQKKSYTQTDIGELTLYYKGNFYSQNPTFTQKETNYLVNKHEISVCVNPNNMPLEGIEKNTHLGISAEYIDIISHELNKDIVLVPTKSWSYSLEKIKNNECEVLPLAIKTENKSEYLNFTSSYLSSNIVIATKIGVPFMDNINKIKNKRFAIVKDYFLEDIIKKEFPNIDLLEVESAYIGLRNVEEGKVFGYIDTTIIMNEIIQKKFLGTITISGKLKPNVKFAIAVNKKDLLLARILDKSILFIDNMTKDKIINKWIKIDYNLRTDYSLFYQFALILISIILITLYWNRKLATLNKQLEYERNKATSASKAKAQFLANMSHEIRTPMNAIIGTCQLLLPSNLEKVQKENIKKIDKSARSLLRIINDILDFSKMEAGKLSFDLEEFRLKDLIKDSMDYIALDLNEKNLDFSLNYDRNLSEYFKGDKLRVTQILTNLLTNAVKFTKEGSITLTVKKIEREYVQFEVKDTGIGLSYSERNKLFKSFSQADTTTSKKYGGTGLGLAICNQLVKMMNGKIWLDSKEEEKGSTFIFYIELKEVKKENVKKEKLDKSIDFSSNKILLVEDNKINQQIIIGLLKKTNISIEIAENGKEALDFIGKNNPKNFELILMDIQMPILDGYETTKELRANEITIPIIALSANALKEDIQKSKESGMNEHLEKPIDIKELIKVLYKYLKSSN